MYKHLPFISERGKGHDPFDQISGYVGLKLNGLVWSNWKRFQKYRPTFRGGPPLSVGPVRSIWTVPFIHSDSLSIPVPRCSVFSAYSKEENTYYAAFMDC